LVLDLVFCFWKLQNMCYEKQASEAKQSKAMQSKYCRDVRTANKPASQPASQPHTPLARSGVF
jgi:hypothetical protein